MRIAISSQGPELSSPMEPRFGRAPYFLILEKPSGHRQVVDNSGNAAAPQGAGIGAVASLRQYDVDVLVTGHVGPKAEKALRAAGIRVRLASATNCNEALRSLNN